MVTCESELIVMEKKRPKGLLKRALSFPFIYLLAPSMTITRWSYKAITPQTIKPDQLKVFAKLTPNERWLAANEIQGWTDVQLVQDRKYSCWFSYLFLVASIGILVSIGFSLKYLNLIQIFSYTTYSAAFFLSFAKKSMRVYAIDHQQIILFGDWFRAPAIWLPF